MAKGIFGKIGGLFVETGEDTESVDYSQLESLTNVSQQNEISVNVNVTKTVSVEEIYAENELSDLSASILKVEEIKSVLPDNLPNDAKKSSVIGMMGVSHLKVEDVLIDADKRISTLNGALKQFTDETITEVTTNEDKIAELENQINELKEKNIERKKSQEDQELIVNTEVKKIQSIVTFVK